MRKVEIINLIEGFLKDYRLSKDSVIVSRSAAMVFHRVTPVAKIVDLRLHQADFDRVRMGYNAPQDAKEIPMEEGVLLISVMRSNEEVEEASGYRVQSLASLIQENLVKQIYPPAMNAKIVSAIMAR